MTLDELKELIANDEGEMVEVKGSIGQRHLMPPVTTPVVTPVGNLGADGSVDVICPSVTAKLESVVHEVVAA